MSSFDGKVAIVTGGASGIGHAIAQRLAIDAGTVVIFDIAGVDATATELGVTGLTGAMQSVVDRFGALHVLVNNAGTDGPAQPLGEYPPEGFDAVVAVNLRGTFLCLRFGIPHLIAAGGGAVVNISSAAALKGVAGLGPYSATKAGVIALTRTAALEYAGQAYSGKRSATWGDRHPATQTRPRVYTGHG
jgi:NAD(P)-dependent dehydrogenase (short-subunit alcohol dehydrogenase family)